MGPSPTRRLASCVYALLGIFLVWHAAANAAGFGADDRVDRHRVKGSVYGAIGLVVHEDGLSTEAGTGFLVSPCHVMTAYHVVAGKEKLNDSSWGTFSRYLYTADLPDPDLVIRTSGETRVSNFLLLQGAYAEFIFSPVLWPDFTKADLVAACAEFGRRERRYGQTSDQLKLAGADASSR